MRSPNTNRNCEADRHVTIDPDAYFELSMDELREVARFAVQSAEDVLEAFEEATPSDARPRAAVEAAWEFTNGARRTNLLRITALDAHRAATEVGIPWAKHAATSAGDAAAAAYLHPFAKANQVGHILRATAHAACAKELLADQPGGAVEAIHQAAARATPVLLDVLRRYPPAPVGKTTVALNMKMLDELLRAD